MARKRELFILTINTLARTMTSLLNRYSSFVLSALLLAFATHATAAEEEAEAKPNQLTAEQIAEGWISLFDGETLFGWTPTSDANWKVEEGAIAVSEGGEGFLMTNSEFGDYELYVEFKAPATTNMPCAKLNTSVALKMTTKPSATSP